MTDLSIIRGDDKTFNLTFQQNGSIMDISEATIFMTIKKKYDYADSAAIFQQTVTDHTSAVSGLTAVSITNGSSYNFDPGDYVYDVQYKSPTGTIVTPARGKFTVYPDVTRTAT